jgi:hypothetical protein
VPWSHDRLFNNQLARTKGIRGFGLRHIDGGFEFTLPRGQDAYHGHHRQPPL